MQKATYNDKVFINCPFDAKYTPLLRAAIFTVYRCGFLPVTSLNEDNALEQRLSKIEDCIQSCRYGIHDISRTQLTGSKLPRFNMPLELGIFFGAKRFGQREQKRKNAIVFDVDPYRYQEFISDLKGVDIKAHNNDPVIMMKQIRVWLRTASDRSTIPGDIRLLSDYEQFTRKLPLIIRSLDLDLKILGFNDYCTIVEKTVASVFVAQKIR